MKKQGMPPGPPGVDRSPTDRTDPVGIPIPKDAQERRREERAWEHEQRARPDTEEQRETRTRKNRERRLLQDAVEHREFSRIIGSLSALQELGCTGKLSREQFRRIDMHIARTNPDVIAAARQRNPSIASVLELVDTAVAGNATEAAVTPLSTGETNDFATLREMSEKSGREIVETGASKRTRKVHNRIRLGVETAIYATTMRDFLHVLDAQIGTTHIDALTELERANLTDQMHAILNGPGWPHPTPEVAESFARWESDLSYLTSAEYTMTTEHANFFGDVQPNLPVPAQTIKKRRAPTPWENLMNAPRDVARFIFDEDGARTGKKSPKKKK